MWSPTKAVSGPASLQASIWAWMKPVEPDACDVLSGVLIVEVADPAHPITQGVTVFTIADEQHTPVLYDEDAVHLILRSRMDSGMAVPAGWVREAGAGRVCHLASGHPVEPLRHPMYQRLLQNAVEWCLRRR